MFTLRRLSSSARANRRKRHLSVAASRIEGVPHYDVEIGEANFDSVARTLLKKIKSWDMESLQRRDFTGGLMNTTVGYCSRDTPRGQPCDLSHDQPRDQSCGLSGIVSETVLIRKYSERGNLTSNRTKEIHNIRELSRHGIAAPLYCTFTNGYCYEFIEGKVCTPNDFTNELVLRKSANLLAEIHSVKLSEAYRKRYGFKPTLFQTLQLYVDLIPLRYNENNLQTQFENHAPSVEILRTEVASMLDAVSKSHSLTVTYCHNDLHTINLIIGDHGGRLRCIDHEYGSPNYSAYDIGNHFNEFTGICNPNYSLRPSKDTQLWWLNLYLTKLRELNGSQEKPPKVEVDQLYLNVQLMSLVAHLLWGLWGLVPEHYCDDTFDYMDYGITRLNEYFTHKSRVVKCNKTARM